MRKFLLGVSLLSFMACSNDADQLIPHQKEGEILLMGETVTVQNKTLSFSNQASFNNVLKKIDEAKFVTTRSAGNGFAVESKFKVDGFRSLYDVYTDALNEAEMYYVTYEKYQEFKNKYSQLYFPEQENDYSAFLPVSNEDLSKILNPEGEVLIDGKLCNMKDITSYEQLKELGKTMPSSDTSVSNQYSQTRAGGMIVCSKINGQGEEVYNPAGDRKMWVFISNRPSGHQGVAYEAFFEVCFRQKGFLGIWYNYTSATSMTMNNALDFGSKNGMSSHDYVMFRTYDNNGMIPLRGYVDIWYQGLIDVIYRINISL